MDLARHFLDVSAERLRSEYLPRLGRALEGLDPADLWWRPHADTTSVGILLRHLAGNIRQWILSGLAGEPDARQRRREFQDPEEGTLAELWAELRTTVEAVIDWLEGPTAEAAVVAEHEIQGYEVSGLEAIYHVVEHFGWHLGQITWIVKQRAGSEHGIAYYDDEALADAHNDRGAGESEAGP